MNSFLSKVIAILMGIFILAYVGYQSFVALYNPYQSETVAMGEYVRDIDLNGFFIRDEIMLDVQKSGVVSYQFRNAQKISNGAVIANIYESEQDIINLKTIERLEKEKAILEEAHNKETIEGQKLDLLNSQIFSAKAELVRQVDENNFSNISTTFNDLMFLINKTAVCVNSELNYDETVASLQAQIDSLRGRLPAQNEVVTTPNSGYFSGVVDGYESVLTPELLKDLSVQKVEDILKNPPKETPQSIGKLVNENTWSFVSTVSNKDIDGLQKAYATDAFVKLRFNSASTREITVKISRIIEEKDKATSVVVFSGSYVDEDIINMRFETPKVILGSYSGIIIPKEAIRLQDGVVNEETGETADRVKGVNTLYGKTVKFKLVDVIYEDSYVLISRPNVKSSYVAGYDQVIIKGKDVNVPSPK